MVYIFNWISIYIYQMAEIYHGIEDDFDLNQDKRVAAITASLFVDMGLLSKAHILKTLNLTKDEYEAYISDVEDDEEDDDDY